MTLEKVYHDYKEHRGLTSHGFEEGKKAALEICEYAIAFILGVKEFQVWKWGGQGSRILKT